MKPLSLSPFSLSLSGDAAVCCVCVCWRKARERDVVISIPMTQKTDKKKEKKTALAQFHSVAVWVGLGWVVWLVHAPAVLEGRKEGNGECGDWIAEEEREKETRRILNSLPSCILCYVERCQRPHADRRAAALLMPIVTAAVFVTVAAAASFVSYVRVALINDDGIV